MGLTSVAAEFLIQGLKNGLSYESTLTLGRQNLFVSSYQLLKMLKRYQVPLNISDDTFHKLICKPPYPFYSEPLFSILGAKEVVAMDNSNYEGASIIHDLNLPIPQELQKRFDVVFDGGLLEHVFNFPAAIKNCMEMTKVGGNIILFTVANNYCGHGFYQFSPELFYRIFSKENGYQVERMIALEHDVGWGKFLGTRFPMEIKGPWYEVDDPEIVQKRVMLCNSKPTALLVQAKRIAEASIFEKTPQQSDYVSLWSKISIGAPRQVGITRKIGRRLKTKLSSECKMQLFMHTIPTFLRACYLMRYKDWISKQSFNNHEHYHKIAPPSGGQKK